MEIRDDKNTAIRTPEGLSAAEREALIERARYEAFREKGANARAMRQSLLAFLVVGVLAGAVCLWVIPMLEGGILARGLFSGAVAGCWGGLAAYWISRDRSKTINAKLQELLAREPKDDTLPTGESK